MGETRKNTSGETCRTKFSRETRPARRVRSNRCLGRKRENKIHKRLSGTGEFLLRLSPGTKELVGQSKKGNRGGGQEFLTNGGGLIWGGPGIVVWEGREEPNRKKVRVMPAGRHFFESDREKGETEDAGGARVTKSAGRARRYLVSRTRGLAIVERTWGSKKTGGGSFGGKKSPRPT